MSEEVIRTLRPGIRNWTVDITNNRITHESGFQVHFRYSKEGERLGQVTAGYPELEGLEDGPRTFHVEWVKRMLVEADSCFEAAIRSNLH